MEKNKENHSEKFEKAAFILKTVSHPTRLAIIELLSKFSKLTVGDINKIVTCEQSLLSHHLINMKLKGILSAEREGQNVYYSLKLREVSKLLAYIEDCECNF